MNEKKIVQTEEVGEELDEFKKLKKIVEVKEKIAKMQIDATSLFLSFSSLKDLCEKAKRLRFGSVRVHSIYVSAAKRFLKGSLVSVCALVGCGEVSSKALFYECKQALKDGADELEVYLSAFYAKNDRLSAGKRLIKKIVKKKKDRPLYVCTDERLSEEEKIKLYLLAVKNGAKGVVTTFQSEEIQNLKRQGIPSFKVKISRSEEAEIAFLLGADKMISDRVDELAENYFSNTDQVF